MVLPVVVGIAAAAVCGILATYPVFHVPSVEWVPDGWGPDDEIEKKLYVEKMNELMEKPLFADSEGSGQYHRNLTSN
ncbi:hypothetical protein GCK72_025082 [Caenorhabditis remanei]|uniref:Uncharacterized protein n=1 Tax=Caenorhabditis remanei TaxID=31234 RepID=A0A6A5G1S9_CAERE|nr:hypothetical protein GCK72_025082 [Caenorhabditis remanei]KAF1748615.1 hypothetical protein GCK72_025082 [Caenorhabditis remanei]